MDIVILKPLFSYIGVSSLRLTFMVTYFLMIRIAYQSQNTALNSVAMFPCYFNGATYKSSTQDEGLSPFATLRDSGCNPLALSNLGPPRGFYPADDTALNQLSSFDPYKGRWMLFTSGVFQTCVKVLLYFNNTSNIRRKFVNVKFYFSFFSKTFLRKDLTFNQNFLIFGYVQNKTT